MTFIHAEDVVGKLVAERPSRSLVFEQNGIDYCCGGKKTLQQACEERNVSLQQVMAALEQLDVPAGQEHDWTQATLEELAGHIVAVHHNWLREALPRIGRLAEKAAAAHGAKNPELLQVKAVFGRLKAELEQHTHKEEVVLFPWIVQMERGTLTGRQLMLISPIQQMEAEHEAAGAMLQQLHSLTGGYVPPAHACNTWRALLDALSELESDLHQHVHKENNILFPRALQMEQQYEAASGEK